MLGVVIPAAQKSVGLPGTVDLGHCQLAVIGAQVTDFTAQRNIFFIQVQASETGGGDSPVGQHQSRPQGAGQMTIAGDPDRLAEPFFKCSHQRFVLGRCTLKRDDFTNAVFIRYFGQIILPHGVQHGGQQVIHRIPGSEVMV